MPNNSETTKKHARKTNNSQSAGMTGAASNAPSFTPPVSQEAPQTSIFPDTVSEDARRVSEVVQGAPSSRQAKDPFVDPGEQEEEDSRSESNLDLTEFGELTKLSLPYRASDLPLDRDLYSEVTIEFPSCKTFSTYGDSEEGLKKSEKVFSTAGRHFQALKLGEASLRRPIASSVGKTLSRNERRKLFSEELSILNELLTNLYCFRDGNRVGFATQRIILVNLNQRLKACRERAEEDLIMSGDGIPSIP